jgi:acyl-CoA synthetase (NDP forming)
VALANPLDYHTFIWGDEQKMTDAFAAMMGDWVDLSVLVIDFPRADRCSDEAWHPAVAAMKRAGEMTGTHVACLGSLAEGIPDSWATRMMDDGIVPLNGFAHGLRAIELAATPNLPGGWRPHSAGPAPTDRQLIDEAAAKAILATAGIAVPAGIRAGRPADIAAAAASLTPPLALKGLGQAHKSEAGLVRVGMGADALAQAARDMPAATGFLVEEMAPPPVAELLVGLRRDPVYGLTLSLGMGGTAAELLGDVVTLVLPVTGDEIRAALLQLRLAPLLTGYRGRDAADIDAAIDAVQTLCGIITANPDFDEIEINPLMLAPAGGGALAVDAVIWKTDAE